MVGVQGKTPTGQSSESVAEAEEELRVGERLGITAPPPPLPRNHEAPSVLLAPESSFQGHAVKRASERPRRRPCVLSRLGMTQGRGSARRDQEVDTEMGLILKCFFYAKHWAPTHTYPHPYPTSRFA